MFRVQKPSLILVFAAVLLVLLPLLAYLQYTWLGKVSEGEREQMQASLQRAADEFRDRFDQEISEIYSSFQPRQPLLDSHSVYAQSYTEWASAARYPQLIAEVLFAESIDGQPHLERLNRITHQFEPAEWPPRLAGFMDALEVNSERFSNEIGVFVRYSPRPIDPDIPALFIPILQPLVNGPRPAYLVLTLSLDCIEHEILPNLAQILPSDYSIKVVDSKNPARVIFRTGPPQVANGNWDVSTHLFSLRPPDVLGIRGAAMAPPPGPSGARSEILSVKVFSSVFPPFAAGIPLEKDSGAWQLVVTHRTGSVATAVAQARRRNLAISSGVLLLLAVSVAMILISTARAQRLARQQMEFVSAVSHELRTPLAVICSAGENLADGVVSDPAHARRYGTLVRDEGRRLTGMIEQILSFSGIRSGRRIYNRRPTDVRDVIREALAAFDIPGKESDFVIDLQLPDDLPPIMADKPALLGTVQNLIGNALKYGGARRWMGIRVSSTSSEVSITVEDRGPGIPSAELPRIFEPFYRGRDAVEAQISGSGLGLSLVKETIEAHSGTVTVASTVGQGSSFRIALPVHV